MTHSIVIGRIGEDAVMRGTVEGNDLRATFTLASQRGRGNERTTTWYDAALFGPRAAKLCPLLQKGTLVHVRGETWIHERDDGKRFGKCKCDEVQFMPRDTDKAE